MIPPPLTLSFYFGFYTITRSSIEARCPKAAEVRDMLQFLGMTEVQARSAMRLARNRPAENFNFEWRQCNV
jgi:hypothetical protein